ncbi:replicative DNA helicase [Streptomyces aidingensis]|uniref:DNA 5'-3' helicase n=1 Tax=Streptomyces aidingensis TaxID=910347 RepID=A0A1I1Q0E9_9ACTN|nr:DnaB-like helicase C-terminal domain-containing protein [Streptomyces aidingensis]SFD13338.1 replicative DNA helicase [Streptomyces aidingensis]
MSHQYAAEPGYAPAGPEPDMEPELAAPALRIPRDEAAEKAVLGAMLISPAAVNDAEDVLGDGRAFRHSSAAHPLIYRAILAVHGRPGVDADPITVADQLRATGDLDRAGGPGYLHRLAGEVSTAANCAYYAEIVQDKHRLAEILAVAMRTIGRVHEAGAEPEQILDELTTECHALLAANAGQTEKLSVADRWEGFVDELSAGKDPDAMDTPWPDLNDKIVFKPKELAVVGAATGGGKSILGLNLGAHVALRRGQPAAVFSMEMSGKELLARLTAAEAEVDLSHLIHRRLTDSDWQRIARVEERMRNARHFILDDQPGLTVGKIRARVRWMTAQGMRPGLVVVDYMQLITPEATRSEASRAQEVAKISRGLKLLAAEADVPVIALAQFNRASVGRKPQVTDFKDSSQIEQDASVILLLHRPLAEDGSDVGERAGEVDVIVGKNRNGPQGTEIPLAFQGRFGRLSSLAPKSWAPTDAIGGAA